MRTGREDIRTPSRPAGPRRGIFPRGLFRRSLLLLPLCLALSGCLETTGSGGDDAYFSSKRRPMGPVHASAGMAGGSVVVRGPDDYCIEGRSLKIRADGGFALLARCDILSGGEMGNPVALAMLTATVTPYEGTLPGAASMARDFAAGGTPVLSSAERDGVRLLHLGAGGNARVRAADPRQWRAVFLVNGSLVSLAAYGPKDSAVAGSGGRALLLSMARAIRAASPQSPAAAPDDAG